MALSKVTTKSTNVKGASASNAGSIVLPEAYADYSELNASAVSWAAIFSGAIAAAALSLILLVLGAGLGLSSISPWAHKGVSAAAFGVAAIVWISVTQIMASGMGGYLAGRLRTKWAGVHTDEVYFRDTAHGFLSWAVASLAMAALLASSLGHIVNGGVKAGAGLAMAEAGSSSYLVDSLFRKDANAAAPTDQNANVNETTQKAALSSEVTRIFINSTGEKTLPSADVSYVGQLVSKQTGLSQQDAEKRVTDIYADTQVAAEKARKASVYTTLWLFISFLLGAFSASLSATWGGRSRDA